MLNLPSSENGAFSYGGIPDFSHLNTRNAYFWPHFQKQTSPDYPKIKFQKEHTQSIRIKSTWSQYQLKITFSYKKPYYRHPRNTCDTHSTFDNVSLIKAGLLKCLHCDQNESMEWRWLNAHFQRCFDRSERYIYLKKGGKKLLSNAYTFLNFIFMQNDCQTHFNSHGIILWSQKSDFQ